MSDAGIGKRIGVVWTTSNDRVALLVLATVVLGLGEDCCVAFRQEKTTSKTNGDGRCDKKWERNLAHKRQRRKVDKKKNYT
ncbi:unnamed protein product [Lasius platythorax]|uniref:Secreted protein n=1 Tax=Lasius platythorax TaxID=488582 RepID=A0AAV2P6Q1_9HYME